MEPESKHRLFAGIRYLPSAPVVRLTQELAKAAAPESGLRVVDPANLHITLKFLGSVRKQDIDPITQVMEQVVQYHGALSLHVLGMGCFRQSLWLGVERSSGLLALVEALDRGLANLGFPREEKPFAPHVTVARLGKSARFKLSDWIEKYRDTEWGDMLAGEIHLYESRTLPEGARYAVLQTCRLATDGSIAG